MSAIDWVPKTVDLTRYRYHEGSVSGVVIGLVYENDDGSPSEWKGVVHDAEGTAPDAEAGKAALEASFREWLEGFRAFMGPGPAAVPSA